jgi:hypothetical protein
VSVFWAKEQGVLIERGEQLLSRLRHLNRMREAWNQGLSALGRPGTHPKKSPMALYKKKSMEPRPQRPWRGGTNVSALGRPGTQNKKTSPSRYNIIVTLSSKYTRALTFQIFSPRNPPPSSASPIIHFVHE